MKSITNWRCNTTYITSHPQWFKSEDWMPELLRCQETFGQGILGGWMCPFFRMINGKSCRLQTQKMQWGFDWKCLKVWEICIRFQDKIRLISLYVFSKPVSWPVVEPFQLPRRMKCPTVSSWFEVLARPKTRNDGVQLSGWFTSQVRS